MKYYYILLLLTITPFLYVNKDIRPSYNKFETMLHNHCDISNPPQFIIRFGETKDAVGYCTYGRYHRVIMIDRNFWNRTDELTHDILVFHELTHCVLDKEHSIDPNNYMYFQLPVALSRAEFYNQVNEVMDEACKK